MPLDVERELSTSTSMSAVIWPTSEWSRPLTPSGVPFPYRTSSQTASPKRQQRGPSLIVEDACSPFLTAAHVEGEEFYEEGRPPLNRHESLPSPVHHRRPADTFTVQYMGMSNGELGVLSKREVRQRALGMTKPLLA